MERNRIARLIRRKVEFRVEEDARLEDVAECTRKEFLQREPASSAHIQASVGSGEVVKHVAVQARFCAESNCVPGLLHRKADDGEAGERGLGRTSLCLGQWAHCHHLALGEGGEGTRATAAG